MKKRLLALLTSLCLMLTFVPFAKVTATDPIPLNSLDLWVEADEGVVTDSNNNVTSWTSKVNSALTNNGSGGTPAVFDKINSGNEAGWTNPKLIERPNGTHAIRTAGKWMGTENFADATSTIPPAPYKGEMTIFFMATTLETYSTQDNVSYFFSNHHNGTTASGYKRRTIEMTRNKNNNNSVSITSNTGFGAGNMPPSVPTVVTYRLNTVDGEFENDGTTPIRNLHSWNNGVRTSNEASPPKTVDFASTSGLRGFDEIWGYRFGHRGNEDVAAIIVYLRALEDNEIAQVTQYLRDKYDPPAPTLLTQKANATGTIITLTTDKDITGSATANDFTVNIDGAAANISNVTISGQKTIDITLSNPIQYGQTVTVSYSGTGIVSSGVAMAAFSNKPVDITLIPDPGGIPTVNSAKLGIYGDKVELKTNKNLDPVSNQAMSADFTVTNGTTTNTVSDIEIKDKSYVLYLNDRFNLTDAVKVSYSGVAIEAFTNMPAQPYTTDESAVKAIPNLDLMLEADDPTLYNDTPPGSRITSWTSKVDSPLNGNSPYILSNNEGDTTSGSTVTPYVFADGRRSIMLNRRGLKTNTDSMLHEGEMTIFTMSKRNITVPRANSAAYFGTNGSSGTENRGIRIYSKGGEGDGISAADTNSAAFYGALAATGSGTLNLGYSTNMFDVKTVRTSNSNMLDVNYDNKPLKFVETFQNGNPISSTTTVTITDPATGNFRGMDRIWGYTVGSADVREFLSGALVYTRSLNDLEREVVEQYLYNKYGDPFSPTNLSFQFAPAGTTDWADTIPESGGGKIRITGGISNRTGQAITDAYAIGAVYDGDQLFDTKLVNMESVLDGTVKMFADNRGSGTSGRDNMVMNLPDNLSNMKIKLMLWDGQILQPLYGYTSVSMARVLSATASADGKTITVKLSHPVEGTPNHILNFKVTGSKIRLGNNFESAELTDSTTVTITLAAGQELSGSETNARLLFGTGNLIVQSEGLPLRVPGNGVPIDVSATTAE